jgi:hypothetical protein
MTSGIKGRLKGALVVMSAAAVVSLTACSLALSQDIPQDIGAVYLPSAILNRSIDMVKNKPVPETSGIKPIPAAAGGGQVYEVGIASRMLNNNPVGTKSATVFYSMNGGKSWNSEEMGTSPADRAKWIAKFKGYRAGQSSLISIFAVNDLGAAVTEAACAEKSAPAPAAPLFAVNDRRPKGCSFFGGPEDPPVDDPPSRAGEDLDLWDFRVGYDSKFLYFALMVEGEISAGSLTPMVLNEYGVVVFNPDSAAKTPEGALPLDGVLIRYVPMGNTAPSLVKPCGAVVYRNKTFAIDTDSVSCNKSEQYLVFRVKRNLWGTKPLSELLIYTHTGTLREKSLDQFSFVDYTHLTRVKLGGAK